MSSTDNQVQAVYEIQVQGELDRGWEAWFNGLAVTLTHTSDQPHVTTLICPTADQAALRGMLCRLWDLNLTLISVRRVEANGKNEEDNGQNSGKEGITGMRYTRRSIK
jgi:hypothetical protein